MRVSRLLSATALVSAVALMSPTIVIAQEATATDSVDPTAQAAEQIDQEEGNASGDIIVTGSRIARPNIDTTVPVTAISAAQIENVGQVSLGETLNRLPALRSSLSQQNSTANIGTAGLNTLDLRGLGPQRTLVLVNGRRHVSGQPGSFAVDVNSIPNALLERVEVVTGGNSGVYGSDAVAGVVNFVLKQDYEGLDVNARGGISERGDRGSYLISGVYGKNFADDRGNIAVSAEYSYQDTLLFSDRNAQTGAFTGTPGFFRTQQTTFRNPDGTARNEPPEGDGIPDFGYFGVNPGSKFGFISTGGAVQTVCPAPSAANAFQRSLVCSGGIGPTGGRISNNFLFMPDGTLVRDVPDIDNRPIGGGVFGGRSATGVEGAMLLPGLDRININLIAHYDVSDAFQPYFEGKVVRITANQTSTQPTFINGRLTPAFFQDNPFLSAQALQTIRNITGTSAAGAPFSFFRFNNDIGTRAEEHERKTYRFVAGARGTLLDVGNWSYDAFVNYGRTETYYETGGNVAVQRFNQAANAVRNAAGNIVCRINQTTVVDPACRPLNLFGEGAPQTTPDGLAYVLHTSSREQWAEQFNAAYSISGDTSGFLRLPGGPIGVALGVEYRRDDYFSAYDDFTKGEYAPGQSNTFLNAIQDSNPDATSVVEAFGELRVPLIADRPFFNELSIEGSGRVSKYNFVDDAVYAYNIGGIYSPVRDLKLRVGFARAVRAPNLSELYAGTSQTFANNFVDPCSQDVIAQEPNRARNCAAAGIPTTITLPNGEVRPWTNAPTSGILGINGGNPALQPEISNSFTVGAIFQPRFLPGFSLTVDYYNIRIKRVINSITPQQIVNRCYEDPVGLDNQFCGFVNRRSTPGNSISDYTFAGQQGRRFTGLTDFDIGIIGNGFTNAPFNYAQLQTSGIDANANYTHDFGNDTRLTLTTLVSWLAKRNEFTFFSDPDRYTRIKSTLGDPEWRGQFIANFTSGPFDLALTTQYIGKQTIGTWNVQNTEQDRPPTNADQFPMIYYPDMFLHDIQVGYNVEDKYRFYFGVDNVRDRLPPFGLTGTGFGSGNNTTSALFPVTGRFFYAGVRIKTR